MSKAFAWLLFLSSVACFVLSLRTQQLSVATEDALAEASRPVMSRADTWGLGNTGELADISDVSDE